MVNGALEVGTETATKVPVGSADRPLLLNVGDTVLYIGNTNAVSSSNGIPLSQNVGYEFPNTLEFSEWNEVWVISVDATGELRYATVG